MLFSTRTFAAATALVVCMACTVEPLAEGGPVYDYSSVEGEFCDDSATCNASLACLGGKCRRACESAAECGSDACTTAVSEATAAPDLVRYCGSPCVDGDGASRGETEYVCVDGNHVGCGDVPRDTHCACGCLSPFICEYATDRCVIPGGLGDPCASDQACNGKLVCISNECAVGT